MTKVNYSWHKAIENAFHAYKYLHSRDTSMNDLQTDAIVISYNAYGNFFEKLLFCNLVQIKKCRQEVCFFLKI